MCIRDSLPEAVAGMGEVKAGMGRGFAGIDAAEYHPQPGGQNIVDHDVVRIVKVRREYNGLKFRCL